MSLNDDITELLDKVFDRLGDMTPQGFLYHIQEYKKKHPEMHDELVEARNEFLKLFSQCLKGEVSFKELTLLMSPTLREAMKYVLIKVLNEVKK